MVKIVEAKSLTLGAVASNKNANGRGKKRAELQLDLDGPIGEGYRKCISTSLHNFNEKHRMNWRIAFNGTSQAGRVFLTREGDATTADLEAVLHTVKMAIDPIGHPHVGLVCDGNACIPPEVQTLDPNPKAGKYPPTAPLGSLTNTQNGKRFSLRP